MVLHGICFVCLVVLCVVCVCVFVEWGAPAVIAAEDFKDAMEEDVKKYRDRLPSATLDEQVEYLEEKLEIIQVCCMCGGERERE